MGPSDHIGDSNNSKSFQHHSDIINGRNIDLLRGDSDSESKWQEGDSDRQTFSPLESLDKIWTPSPQYSLQVRYWQNDCASAQMHISIDKNI